MKRRIIKALTLMCVLILAWGVPTKAASSKLAAPKITLSNVESTGKVKITWKKVSKAVSYKVYYSLDKKKWTLLTETKKLSVTHAKAKLLNTYYYRVRAFSSNKKVYSAYSNVKSRTCRYAKNSGLTEYQMDVVNLALNISDGQNTTYKSGKTGQKVNGKYAYDCSGFTTHVLNSTMEKKVPVYRLTGNLRKLYALEYVYNEGYKGALKVKTIKRKNMKPGDVVFFSMEDSGTDHCGIYLGDNKFVHCSSANNGVLISEITGYYEREFTTGRRYIPQKVTPANTVKTVKGGTLYAKKESGGSNLEDKITYLSSGEKVTVLYTGNSPARYNCAYVKADDGTKGFIYTKYLK